MKTFLVTLRGLIAEARAGYGKKQLLRLADRLTAQFGGGFDDRNLRNMRAFYLAYPIWNAVRTELSSTHYRWLLLVDHADARGFLMEPIEAYGQGFGGANA